MLGRVGSWIKQHAWAQSLSIRTFQPSAGSEAPKGAVALGSHWKPPRNLTRSYSMGMKFSEHSASSLGCSDLCFGPADFLYQNPSCGDGPAPMDAGHGAGPVGREASEEPRKEKMRQLALHRDDRWQANSYTLHSPTQPHTPYLPAAEPLHPPPPR